ncbi:hypothetical protein [Parapedobacter soli]|uniref:hypothetical protein n=1 Tax=Parapedobacter soli TaxID=416955 RepID=UPI0021C7FAED|nr:hypothetical protein [Parapedobacter soli]
MKTEICTHLNNPVQLEILYRTNRAAFKQSFNDLLPTLKGNIIAECWDARLNYTGRTIDRSTRMDLIFITVAAITLGFIGQFPTVFGIDSDFFYSRNIGFMVFPPLTMYFAWKHRLPAAKIAFLFGAMLICLLFINLMPDIPTSDTVVLSCFHLILILWSILGIAFVGSTRDRSEQRIRFLTYNGDLLVMMALISMGGAILSGITVNLFSAIGFNIEEAYFRYVGITGAVAIPLVATYLIRSNPQLVGKISPIIARIFCPLVLAMLIIFLPAMVYGGKDPYTDREFLLIFNILLIGVMAIIFFSIAGTSDRARRRTEVWVITLLAIVTVVVNAVALSAILFRITEWGITPNRVAVLGANLLAIVNLLLAIVQLFSVLRGSAPIDKVQNAVARYLPVYCLWAIAVTFIFPLVFGW